MNRGATFFGFVVKLALPVACMLCGCSDESFVDIRVPGGYQSKLVVESQFMPDSLWVARISRSIPVEATGGYGILSDAVVVISREGERGDTLRHVGEGLYQTARSLRPLAGQRYRLQVQAPGLATVEASSWSPPLESELVEVLRHTPQDPTGEEQISVRLKLKDPPVKNYYSVALYEAVPVCHCTFPLCSSRGLTCAYNNDGSDSQTCIDETPGATIQYWRGRFESPSPFLRVRLDEVDDPLARPEVIYEDGLFRSAFFTDDLFEDSVQELDFQVHSLLSEASIPLFKLVVTTLSTEWFRYERSLGLHDQYQLGGDIFSSRPVEVYSNVQDGLGVFAGSTNDTYWFDAEGKPWDEDVVGVGAGVIQPCDTSSTNRAFSF